MCLLFCPGSREVQLIKNEISDLPPIARTLLVPLVCRAQESNRSDAILKDPRSVELLSQIGTWEDAMMGMSAMDQTFTVMRARQFDHHARSFLEVHPDGLVVDIGCGLDTRFDRLDNGRMSWLGLDLPEVIELRQCYLPESDRNRVLAKSMLDHTWLEEVARLNNPTIFLAEGVFVYFTEDQVKPLISTLAERFSGNELVFDALSRFSVWVHNRSHSVLKETGIQISWGVDKPRLLESWGLTLLDKWSYFDDREPRIGWVNLLRLIPPLASMNIVLHYRLRKQAW
jgi:O-methyltransferase involved in polyketide biosynthesis